MSSRTGILPALIVISILLILPEVVFAEWKVYYTGKAAKMFGSYGRGSFATKGQCESYRMARPGFEANNSYCSGFDTAPPPSTKQGQPAPGKTSGATQGQAAKQPQPVQAAPQESPFAKDREQLLGSIKMPPPTGDVQPGGTSFFGLGGGHAGPEARAEQDEFEKMNEQWMKKQRQLITQRLREPNRWASSIYRSLRTKAPPLPYKKLDELQPGDTLLIEGSKAITAPDRKLSGKDAGLAGPPAASHTVLYLKEINGRKFFLDNQPGEGPRIVPEDYVLNKYGSRGIEVAKLAQPLSKEEAERLYAAARQMRAKNLKKTGANKWFDSTTYGVWGKDNVVCSEADWALIRASGRDIPGSDDSLKKRLGVDFSPQDFYDNEQYFLVSPLAMPQR